MTKSAILYKREAYGVPEKLVTPAVEGYPMIIEEIGAFRTVGRSAADALLRP
jgi:hypothetical protein